MIERVIKAAGKNEIMSLLIASSNKKVVDKLFCELISAIKTCIMELGRVSMAHARERAIKKFHQLRLNTLPEIWNKSLAELEITSTPVLLQSINRLIFNEILTEHFSTNHASSAMSSRPLSVHMSSEEENAIRYASGFVTMRLKKIYEQEHTNKARQFVECLANMSVEGDGSNFYEYTKIWISTINRGGLFEINDSCFLFFRALELKVQECLPHHLKGGTMSKEQLFTLIMDDEDVNFLWSMLSINIDSKYSDNLLRTIVEKWVTLRGFTITSSWLQEYKDIKAKQVSKKKALRKELAKKKSKKGSTDLDSSDD